VDFVKEFAIFLQKSGAIKFGNFRLSSGKDSAYYIDLRLVPSFPHQFRKMIKSLQSLISDKIGLDSFDYIASVPTSGLVIASALSIEAVKPLIYIRQKPKDYGTSSLIEGKIPEGSRVVLVDDVGTTGHSLLHAVKALKEAKMKIEHAFVIVNRLEDARKNLEQEGVKLYEITDILALANILHSEEMIDSQTIDRINSQMSKS
jgi:orotate phosphoribosyltransferase